MTTKTNQIVAAFSTEGADKVAADINKIQSEAEDLGKGGASGATKLAESFDRTDTAIQKVIAKTGDLRAASDRELTAMAAEYIKLEDQIVATFGSIEAAPAETKAGFDVLTANLKGAADQAKSVTDYTERAKAKLVELGVGGAAAAKQVSDAITVTSTAVDQLGDTAVAALSPIETALRNVANADAQVTQKINEGATITERDGKRMIQTFELLQQTIRETYGDIAKAPAEVQRQYAAAEAQYVRTTGTVRRLTEAVGDNRIVMKDAAGQIQTTGMAVSQLSSVLPGAAGHVGALTGNVASMIGQLDAAKDALVAMKINTINSQTSLAALGIQVAAVAAVWQASIDVGVELSKALGANAKTAEEFKDTFGLLNVATMGAPKLWADAKTALAAWNVAAAAGIPAMERLGTSTETLKKIANDYTEIQKAGAAGEALWNAARKQAGDDTELLSKILDSALPQLAAYQTAQKNAADAVKDHGIQTKELDDKLKAFLTTEAAAAKQANDLKAANEGLSDTERKRLELIANAEKVTKGMTGSMAELLQSILGLLPKSEEHSQLLKLMANDAQALLEKTDGLTKAERDRIAAIIDSVKAAADGDASARASAEAKIREAEAARNVQTSHAALVQTYENGRMVIKQAADGAEEVGKGFISIKNAAGEVPTHLGRVSSELAKANPQFEASGTSLAGVAAALKDANLLADDLIKKAPQLADALTKVGEAAKAAAGSAPSESSPDFVGPKKPS